MEFGLENAVDFGRWYSMLITMFKSLMPKLFSTIGSECWALCRSNSTSIDKVSIVYHSTAIVVYLLKFQFVCKLYYSSVCEGKKKDPQYHSTIGRELGMAGLC